MKCTFIVRYRVTANYSNIFILLQEYCKSMAIHYSIYCYYSYKNFTDITCIKIHSLFHQFNSRYLPKKSRESPRISHKQITFPEHGVYFHISHSHSEIDGSLNRLYSQYLEARKEEISDIQLLLAMENSCP